MMSLVLQHTYLVTEEQAPPPNMTEISIRATSHITTTTTTTTMCMCTISEDDDDDDDDDAV